MLGAATERARDPEIGHDGSAVGEQEDVLRLHVAVDHVVPVRIVEGQRRLPADAESVLHWELTFAPQSVPQRLALDIGHGEPQATRGFARVVDREDVRVLEARGELDLVLETLRAERLRELGVEDLEGNEAVVLEIVGQVDRGHASAAEFPVEHVAVTKSIAQGRVNDSHRNCLEGMSGMCSQQQRNARNSAVDALHGET